MFGMFGAKDSKELMVIQIYVLFFTSIMTRQLTVTFLDFPLAILITFFPVI
jgi:hypothetical protein